MERMFPSLPVRYTVNFISSLIPNFHTIFFNEIRSFLVNQSSLQKKFDSRERNLTFLSPPQLIIPKTFSLLAVCAHTYMNKEKRLLSPQNALTYLEPNLTNKYNISHRDFFLSQLLNKDLEHTYLEVA